MAAVWAGVIPASLSIAPVLLFLQAAFVHKSRWTHRAAAVVFALYIWTVFTLCGVPGISTVAGDADVNWIPFTEMRSDAVGIFLNTMLFVPLGMLLPLVWREFRAVWRTVLFGFTLSLFIECSQLLNFRITDVEDLVMNTAGTVLGWILYLPLGRTVRDMLAADDPQSCGIAEAVFAVLVVFLYTFFLAPVFG